MIANNEKKNDGKTEHVGPECPHCGEDDVDKLVWQDDVTVKCETCGTRRHLEDFLAFNLIGMGPDDTIVSSNPFVSTRDGS